MTVFYKKNESGEYVDADKDVDDLFRQKSDNIVSAKLGSIREKESARIREEIEADVRKNAAETLKAEARKELEAEYKSQLAEAASKAEQLDMKLRRKTIAAEYGFKPEMEGFLGDGSDDDMKAKADLLKTNMQMSTTTNGLEKHTDDVANSNGAVTLIK